MSIPTCIEESKRIVVKIGSSILVEANDSKPKASWLASLCEDVVGLCRQGKEVIIVSSGAVALGRGDIGKTAHLLKLEEKQAAAACGQTKLVVSYQEAFAKYKMSAAQILVTIQDSENRRRYLNARNTIDTLLANGIIPIINENDTVATNELRFGDNDRLAARVAQMSGSDMLIILSDIDGLYTANPKLSAAAKHIEEVTDIDDDMKQMAGGALSGMGSGGMITKLAAAEIALQNGCHMVIASGVKKHPIRRIQRGEKATCFVAKESPLSARKNWIANRLHVRGEVIIDDGALRALKDGKSLLPAGVIEIKGKFKRGDAVSIKNCRLQEVGRGLSAYPSKEAAIIAGQQSSQIANLVGFAGRDELVHRDDLVLSS